MRGSPDTGRPARDGEVTIRINGERIRVPTGSSVEFVIEDRGLKGKRVAVELNREILPRSRWETTVLAASDTVEIVQFVGGG